MAKQFDLVAEERTDSGKGASRRLRRAGKVPAIVYGAGRKPRPVCFDHDTLLHKMENEAFFSSVLKVNVKGKARQCILKDVQMHPAKRRVMHLDLQRIVEDEEIRMTVPIHFINEDTAPGVKVGGGTAQHTMSEVEISCLPANLPEYLELDVGALELDESLMLSDIKLPEGVVITDLVNDNDRSIVSIHVIKEVVIEDDDEADAGEAADGEAADGDADDQAGGDEPKEGDGD